MAAWPLDNLCLAPTYLVGALNKFMASTPHQPHCWLSMETATPVFSLCTLSTPFLPIRRQKSPYLTEVSSFPEDSQWFQSHPQVTRLNMTWCIHEKDKVVVIRQLWQTSLIICWFFHLPKAWWCEQYTPGGKKEWVLISVGWRRGASIYMGLTTVSLLES